MQIEVKRIRLSAGGYDAQGAYWGEGLPLFYVFGGDETGTVDDFIRARDAKAARQAALGLLHS